ncbi:hypothetical protein ACFQ0M_48795 [Kitasatospora aburaviensis]|uniref:Uncharacterized protein n=1 Tax=Kitasatospora aburaviensis TaxID=67265 RepID=A0ABW1F2U0_9ACTN
MDSTQWTNPIAAPTGPVPGWPASVPPPPPAAAPTAHLVGTRERAEVEAIVVAMEDERGQPDFEQSQFEDAVLDTYRWALGRRPAPVTGRTGPVDDEALDQEDDTADALIYTPGSIPQKYAVGVQHAAMWLRGQTDDQPWPGVYTWSTSR